MSATSDLQPLYSGVSPEWAARLRLLDRMHNLLAVCKGNAIVHLNPAGVTLLGLTSAEMAIGSSFFSFAHRDYAELAELGLSVFADESAVVSMKLVREDSSDADVELWVTHLSDDNGADMHLVEAHDITEHLRSARALRAREQRLEGIINTVADGIITVDENGSIQTFNPAAETIFGFSKAEVIGRNIRSLIPDTLMEQPDGEANWVRALASGSNVTGKHKSGDSVPLEVAVREMHQGEELSFTSIVRDISARKAAEERIFHMAHHDALTGLPNRHLFGDRVEEAFKRAVRHEHKLALLFVDLNKFKPINDTYGHASGDIVLKEVAERLRRGVRATDTVARVGGDEFMVLLEELSGVTEAREVRAKIEQLFAAPLNIPEATIAVSASIGISVYPDDGSEIADLMQVADQAMYRAKKGGGS